MGSDRRVERGVALLMTTVLSVLIALSAVAALSYADAVASRVRGERRIQKAASIAESGLNYYAEMWRRSVGSLDINDTNADGLATTAAENPNIDLARPLGGGTFKLVRIQNASIGSANTMPKLIDVTGTYDGASYTWRAFVSPNVLSPIQGSGTKQNQTWRAGSSFTAIGGGSGTVFANGNATISGGQIDGDVKVQGSITISGGGTISGIQDANAAAIVFPNVDAMIAAKVTEAKGRAASYWSNPLTSLVVTTPLTAGEAVNADPVNYGSGWTTQANLKSQSMALKGGVAELPAGNYAFGRLWLDGTILTIKAPPGGGTVILPDVYITNGARLILDASDGPFSIIQGQNQAFELSTDVAYPTNNTATSTVARKWNGSAWAFATNGKAGAADPLSMTFNGTGTNNLWYKTGGVSSTDTGGPKSDRGTGSGYDDWIVRDPGSAFITVTPGVASKGAEMWMPDGSDFVMADGGKMLAGIGSAHLATLKDPTTTVADIGAMSKGPTGFIAWSGGGSNARFNMSAGAGAGGAGTEFQGVVFGEYEATLGANASYTGAFVGYSIDSSGDMAFDSGLVGLATTEDTNSQHVVFKFRVRQ